MSRNRLFALSLLLSGSICFTHSLVADSPLFENESLFNPSPQADVQPSEKKQNLTPSHSEPSKGSLFNPSSIADVHPSEKKQNASPPELPFELPWFTGPIIAPSGHVIPVGHYNIEPYFNTNVVPGVYDSHWKGHSTKHNFYNINTQVPVQIGIFNRADFSFTPQFSWNHFDGASRWVYNDMPLGIDYQIYYDYPDTWPPAMKLALRVNAPLGKYQKLNPDKKGTDIGGAGSWFPSIGLDMSRLFHFTGVHFLSARLAFAYTFPTPVHVKGFNAYGGGHHTHGKVFPGQAFSGVLGLEYSLTRRWALALDVLYVHTNHTRFSGHKGKTDGVTNVVGRPSSEQFSLAPAIEYNWNGNYGIIAGVFFSVAGRNTAEFVNGVVAFNIYH